MFHLYERRRVYSIHLFVSSVKEQQSRFSFIFIKLNILPAIIKLFLHSFSREEISMGAKL